MTYAAIGLKRITHVGAIGVGAGSVRSIWAYLTNDDSATVETANYFDAMIDEMKKGDIIFASLDIDGTPTLRQYVVNSVTGHVTIARDVAAVTGDQAAIADPTALTDSPASADALRDDIEAKYRPVILAILARLRLAEVIAT